MLELSPFTDLGQRQALELHCLEGYSKEEIAHIMDKSYKAVEHLINRALKKILES